MHAATHKKFPASCIPQQQIWGQGSPSERAHGAASLTHMGLPVSHPDAPDKTLTPLLAAAWCQQTLTGGVLCFAQQREDPSHT